MTGGYHLAAAQARATATMSKHQPSLIVGLLVLDWQGQPAEIVATPFVSEAAARQWAQQNGVTSFLLLPARLAGAR